MFIDQKTFYIHNLDKAFTVCKFTSELKGDELYRRLFDVANKKRQRLNNYQSLPELVYITSGDSQQTGLYLMYDRTLFRLSGQLVYTDEHSDKVVQLQQQIDQLQKQLDTLTAIIDNNDDGN